MSRAVSGVSSPGKTAQVSLMVGIPVLTTFFVLGLGLVVLEITQRSLLAADVLSTVRVEAAIGAVIVAVVMAAACAFFAGVALALYVTRSMRQFADRARSVARGDLAGGAGDSASFPNPPEFAALGASFDRMVESLNKTFVGGVNSGVILIDISGKVTFANQNAADLLGFNFDNVVNKQIEEGTLGGGDFRGILSIVRETLDSKVPVEGKEVNMKSPRGEDIQLRIGTALFRDSGARTTGVSLIIEDVTSLCLLRKDLEELEKLVTRAGFVEGVAHQVRNPLCSIRGYAQLIKEKGGTVATDLPDGIINNVDIIDGVIRTFLDAPERDMAAGDNAAAAKELRSALLPEQKRRA